MAVAAGAFGACVTTDQITKTTALPLAASLEVRLKATPVDQQGGGIPSPARPPGSSVGGTGEH